MYNMEVHEPGKSLVILPITKMSNLCKIQSLYNIECVTHLENLSTKSCQV